MPTPRTEVAVAALDGKIFAAGGFISGGAATDVVEVYDPQSDRWTESVPLPAARHHMGLTAADGRLYAVAGYDKDGRATSTVWSRTVPNGRWREETELPTPRGALAVVATEPGDDPQIFAIGGANDFTGRARLTGAVESFSPDTETWTEYPELPEPRDHLAAALDRDSVFVVGGRKLSLETNQDRLDILRISLRDWSEGPEMPTARGGLAACTARGEIYVFGGEEPPGTFEEAEVFEPTSKVWFKAPDLPTPRHGLGAAAIGDRVYVVGGGPEPGLSVSGVTEILHVGG
ncbi:MAG: kelch repeat-containing protein [Actinomycetota bacterium]